MTATRVSAAVLLIGDEILSGRTQDLNLQAIARFLQPLGVVVAEARVVADDQSVIVEALNALRARCDYVFTTGGIGPTHDDITADAVAAAFGAHIDVRADALAILEAAYGSRNEEITPARLRMARIPDGAVLIPNAATAAPGFQMENVFVLAGVPSIMRAMLQAVEGRIEGGAVVHARTVRAAMMREGQLGEALAAMQAQFGETVALGSYPYFRGLDDYGVNLVARGTDKSKVDDAIERLTALVSEKGGTPEVDPDV